jgi:DNA-binding transcriptional LysR family regulator
MSELTIAFDVLTGARWGPLFHVLRLEQPDLRLRWRALDFPPANGSLLDGADAGLFVAPPREPGVGAITLETSALVVAMAAGNRLSASAHVDVATIVGEPFVDCPGRHPECSAFWTLDKQRGSPPRLAGPGAGSVAQCLDVIASGAAIGTFPVTVADALPHPGVVAAALHDGPRAATCLVWREDGGDPFVRSLIALGRAMSREAGHYARRAPGGLLRRRSRRPW